MIALCKVIIMVYDQLYQESLSQKKMLNIYFISK